MATAAETTSKSAPRARAAKRQTTARRSTRAEATTAKTDSAEHVRRHRPRRRRDLDISFEATDQVLEQLENGGQQAIGAVREFVASVDRALPNGSEGPTRAHSIIDSALDMSDRMVTIGSDAIRGIVRSAGRNYGSSAKS